MASIPENAAAAAGAGYDEMAVTESDRFGSDRDLEKEANEAQHGRREKARNHVGLISVISMWFAFVLISLAAGIYAMHLIGPERLRYLSDAEILRVQETLSHIVVGVVVGFILKNRFV